MNMFRYIWPWESDVVIHYPWILPLFFIILTLPLSIISWIREKKRL